MTAPVTDDVTGMVTVRGELHPRAGRRTHHAVVVPCCPWCAHLHVHRTAAALPYYVRSPSCAGHRTYLIAVGDAPLPPTVPAPAPPAARAEPPEPVVIER